MEADSTTYDNTKSSNEDTFPFAVNAGNLKLYRELIENSGEKHLEHQLVERLQSLGLLPVRVPCLSNSSECKVVKKSARVIDKVQWSCKGCKKRQPIRTKSFFLRLQCSLLQALQIILAWCEDAECSAVAEYFNVKPRVASLIYDRLDELAVSEQSKYKLGGEDSVVLAEMYPDCLNRLSPDTTDQPHVHQILMLADTNHIPTHYQLHVISVESIKNGPANSADNETLKAELESVVQRVVSPGSLLVSGSGVPVDGAVSLNQLFQHTDSHMQQFLSTRIWRQAVTLCTASRELCSASSPLCYLAVQRYLQRALFTLRLHDSLYHHMLTLIARDYTDRTEDFLVKCVSAE